MIVDQGRRGWLVYDAHHIKAGNLSSPDGGSPLSIVEVGGHRDDDLFDRMTQTFRRPFRQMLEDVGRDLLGGEILAGPQ